VETHGIDCHAHVFSVTAPVVTGARYRPAYEATLEAWRDHWAASGITHGVLVQPSFFGTDNTEMLAAIAKAPALLRGVAVVDETADTPALRLLHDGGARAIRLNLHGDVDFAALGSRPWLELFDRVQALGWHVEAFVDTEHVPELARAMASSTIPLVLDHFGVPGRDANFAEETFAAAKELSASRPVWCKLSAPYRLEGANADALATRWIETLGEERLVWGSDWPWTRHEQGGDYGELRGLLDMWVGVKLARRILWDNAARLYGFDSAALT
jgi:predicted TIM-barrel fold metal-dependent hydrolase